MSTQNPLATFEEDLIVFRQLTIPTERAAFTRLMKRAYAQGLSACVFVQRSPERQVSAHIRRLCEAALTQLPASPSRQAPAAGRDKPDGGTLPAVADR
jgi:hypothetical protein